MYRLPVIVILIFASGVSIANISKLFPSQIERVRSDEITHLYSMRAETRMYASWSRDELANIANENSSAALAFALRHQNDEVGSTAQYIQLLKNAIGMGSTDAINQLAYEYWKGDVVAKNIQKATKLFEDAIEKNNDFAMVNLALMYEEIDYSFEKSFSLMEKAALLRNQLANFWLGQEYLLGENLPRNLPKAERYLKQAGNSFSLSLYKLGELYIYQYLTLGMDSLESGLASFRKASELGHPVATAKLLIAYADKDLPIYNRSQFRLYLARLADQDTNAFAFYASLIELHFAENQSEYEEAKTLIEELETGGNKNVGYFLGEIYRRGLGVEVDYDLAYSWYLRGAEGGVLQSNFNAAVMILNGLVNDTKGYSAKKLLITASDAGHEGSRKLLERIDAKENK